MKKLILLLPIFVVLYVNMGLAQLSSPILSEPPVLDRVVSTTVTFRWVDLTGVLSYSLEIANDPLFITATGPGISVATSSYSAPEGVLAPNTVYYWRVRGIFPEGPGPCSQVFSFKTAGTPSQETDNLGLIVDGYVQSNELTANQGNILNNKLNQAQHQLDLGHNFSAAIQLLIFEARVLMLHYSDQLTAAQANDLNDYANKILALMFGGANKIPRNITAETPTEFSLSQNYPNPFNPSTDIEYSLPEAGNVTLKVYDMLGKEVASLVDKHQDAGSYLVNWNAAGLSSGVYFYRLSAGQLNVTKKMILSK